MPDQLQLRGGTTSEHNSFTGLAREITVDTTKKTLVVHDGTTAGGKPLMRESGGNSATSVAIGSGGTNALGIDTNQDITFTGASANAVWDKSDNSLNFADDAKVILGTGDDLILRHNATNSYCENITGDLQIKSNALHLRSYTDAEAFFTADKDSSVSLYYDNAAKLKSQSHGIEIIGNLGVGNDSPYSNASFDSLTIGKTKKGLIELKDENNVAKAHLYENSGDFNISTVGSTGNIKLKTGGSATDALSIAQNQAATFSSTVTSTGFTESSDVALKSNIEPLTNVLDKINQITGYKYKFTSTNSSSMGVMAQDVEKVFPELVHGEEGSKSLQYSGLIGALIESIKELSAKVSALENS